jgi:hypothetical protein
LAHAAAIAAAFGACGHPHPPLLGDYEPDAGAGNELALDSGSGVPRCELVQPDGSICGCTDVPLLTDKPTLYFVLDRSGSMNEANKWQTVRGVVAKVITAIGPRATFAAAVFPSPAHDACAPGVEVMTPRAGDSPAGRAGYTTNALLNATNVPASGGTPTAATFAALKPRLQSLASAARTYVILATDGGPNCNAQAQCDVSACIANIESAAPGCSPGVPPNCCTAQYYGPGECLDAAPTIAAASDLHAAGIDTYVVGVPGSGPYASVLDQIATAGNTARSSPPLYYRVDSVGEAAFLSAISQIAAKIVASCTLPLSAPPPNSNEVNVFLDDQPVAKDPVNGWTLDGATITLKGATCDAVLSGNALDVRVIVGCPTVGPK